MGAARVLTRPPWAVLFVGVLLVALGETAGAVGWGLRTQIAEHTRARVVASPERHGLAGTAEYDTEVIARTVYAVEAGLSFLHTHAQGLGPLVIFTTTLAASAVPWRRARGAVHALVALGGLFPLGYLVYSLGVIERGRDAGIEMAERSVLSPLGAAVIAGLLALAVLVVVGRRRGREA
jgi:hypothetical protein